MALKTSGIAQRPAKMPLCRCHVPAFTSWPVRTPALRCTVIVFAPPPWIVTSPEGIVATNVPDATYAPFDTNTGSLTPPSPTDAWVTGHASAPIHFGGGVSPGLGKSATVTCGSFG